MGVRVGCLTPFSIRRAQAAVSGTKVRVEDVLKSTRAAVEEGVVPGGGVSLIRALKDPKDIKGDRDDLNVGQKR